MGSVYAGLMQHAGHEVHGVCLWVDPGRARTGVAHHHGMEMIRFGSFADLVHARESGFRSGGQQVRPWPSR
jgi:hypothetical protein